MTFFKNNLMIDLFLATLLFSAFLVSSCNNYESSEITMYYTDSIPKLKVFYKYEGNKKIISKEIRYYPNRQIQSVGHYNAKYKKTGKWHTYFENRKTQRIENYKAGVLNGKYVEYYLSGKRMYTANYKNGLPDGEWSIWNEKGIKISTTFYKDGQIIKK